MYVDWPASLPDPEAPFTGDVVFPIIRGADDTIGAYVTARNTTRPTVTGSATLIFEDGDQFNTFKEFWRDTLTNGTSRFNATWIALLGYAGYYAKILSYEISINGVMPTASIELQLIPGVNLDGGDVSPWPAP